MHGITQRTISTLNPYTNGLVERYNTSLKSWLLKFLIYIEGEDWWDFIQDTVCTTQILLNRSTGHCPHLLVFKQSPEVPLHEVLCVIAIEKIAVVSED